MTDEAKPVEAPKPRPWRLLLLSVCFGAMMGTSLVRMVMALYDHHLSEVFLAAINVALGGLVIWYAHANHTGLRLLLRAQALMEAMRQHIGDQHEIIMGRMPVLLRTVVMGADGVSEESEQEVFLPKDPKLN